VTMTKMIETGLFFQGIRVIASDDIVITGDDGAGALPHGGVPSTTAPPPPTVTAPGSPGPYLCLRVGAARR
jgi:hypothetical protein